MKLFTLNKIQFLRSTLFLTISLTLVGCAVVPTTPIATMPVVTAPIGSVPVTTVPVVTTQQNLFAAGFLAMAPSQTVVAFESLPPAQISTVQIQGQTYYAYPDQMTHQVLLGQNNNFVKYNTIVNAQLPSMQKMGNTIQNYWSNNMQRVVNRNTTSPALVNNNVQRTVENNSIIRQDLPRLERARHSVQRYWNNNIMALRRRRAVTPSVANNSNLVSGSENSVAPTNCTPAPRQISRVQQIGRSAERDWKKIGV